MSTDRQTAREEACLPAEVQLDFPCNPSTPPLIPAAVWQCHDIAQADALLAGSLPGFVYQRDGHPNAAWLAERCAQLHAADAAAITSSGMAALSAILLAATRSGDTIAFSHQLYGRSTLLLTTEAERLGLRPQSIDPHDLDQVRQALAAGARMLVVETLSNPRLRVAPLEALARETRQAQALLVVDNTFATPLVCRPLDWGADLVYESVSKAMNGHGDLMLGMIAGRRAAWDRIEKVISTWGFASSPFDCWLAQRGLGTLGVRIERACRNAAAIAQLAHRHPSISHVDYPGLTTHPDHQLARQLLISDSYSQEPRFGHVVTLHLRGGRTAADQLLASLPNLPFCPSLGELRTTLSHPASTSHRGWSAAQRQEAGIDEGTIRVSAGIEPTEVVLSELQAGLDSLDRKPFER